MSVANELLERLDKLQTTELGIVRIKRNLSLDVDDVVEWCRDKKELVYQYRCVHNNCKCV